MRYRELAYLILILLISFFAFKQCEQNKNSIKIFSEIPKIDTLRFSDTIIIPFEKKVFVTKYLVPEKKEVIILKGDSINVYTTIIKDSLINGEIISNIKGELINQKLIYKPLFPKEIKIIDSVIITKPTLFCKKKANFMLALI
tara:strand:+ start:2274 stop:2702 length:429 start_codon:yes stop_codon:yes gene_type:complete